MQGGMEGIQGGMGGGMQGMGGGMQGMGGGMQGMGGGMQGGMSGGMQGGMGMGGQGMMPIHCGFCKQQIDQMRPYIKVFNTFWHPNHLCCNSCQKDFTDPERKVKEGPDRFAYCFNCFSEKFAPKCSACNLPVVGECVNALNKVFHKSCFVCSNCKKPFTGAFFATDQGQLLCERHYFESKGLICPGCDAAITSGKMISVGNRKYHPDHFECSRCKTKLAGQQFNRKEEKPFCPSCYTQMFG